MKLVARDALVAVALAALFAALYLATLQGRVFGNDGAFLCEWAVLPDAGYAGYHNVLFHRIARVLTTAFAGEDPLLPVRALCAVSTAIGVGLTFALCRALGAGRAASVLAAALLGASPAAWFFGTTVEVHSLYFAVVALCAVVIALAPWQRPAVALGMTCVMLPLTYLSHQAAPALGLGWLLLVQCGRVRRCAPFGWPALLGVGAAMLAALLLGQAIGNAIRGFGFGLRFGEVATTVGAWQRTAPLRVAWHEVAAPLAVLLPVALAGQVRERSRRAAAAAALFWPTAVAAVWWGIVERGGYALAPAIGLAILAAGLADRAGRVLRGVLVGLLGLQVALGVATVQRFDAEGFRIDDRVAIVDRLLEGSGWVVSATNLAPSAKIWLPDVEELDLLDHLAVASVDEWKPKVPILLGHVGAQPFVLDRSYTLLEEHWRGLFRECMEHLEAEIRARFEVEEHPDPSWPVWLARPR